MMMMIVMMRRYHAGLNFCNGIIIIIVVVSIIIFRRGRRRTMILSSGFIGAERSRVGDAFSHGFVFGVEIVVVVVRVSCSCCTDDEKVLSADAFGAFPLSGMTDEKPPTGDHGVADHEEESESSHELCEMRERRKTK